MKLKNEKEIFRTYNILDALNYKEKREKEGYRVYIYSGVDILGRYIITEKKILCKNCLKEIE